MSWSVFSKRLRRRRRQRPVLEPVPPLDIAREGFTRMPEPCHRLSTGPRAVSACRAAFPFRAHFSPFQGLAADFPGGCTSQGGAPEALGPLLSPRQRGSRALLAARAPDRQIATLAAMDARVREHDKTLGFTPARARSHVDR